MDEYLIQKSTLTSLAQAVRSKWGGAGGPMTPLQLISSLNAIPNRTASDLAISGHTVIVPWGNYVNMVDLSIAVDDSFKQLVEGTLSSPRTTDILSVRDYAFYNCSNLQMVNFQNCTMINQSAFYNCSQLSQITFPECDFIANNAFCKCSSLVNVNFPKCTAMSGTYIFSACVNLQNASFPKLTEKIPSYTFYNCSKLATVQFPLTKGVDNYAFANCSSLTKCELPAASTVGSNAFSNCYKMSQISLPTCRTIASQAFRGCSSLTVVSLPSGSTIASHAFSGCTSLSKIVLSGSTLCTLANSNAFSGTQIKQTTGSIIVNSNLLASYKTATNWTFFSSRIYSGVF